MTSLKGKLIYISGGARRIGRALALAAARAGADLIVHYNTSPAEAESLAEEVRQLGRRIQLYQADFADPQGVETHAREVFAAHQVDALINNASLFGALGWSDTSLAEWQAHLAVNLTAPFLLSQAFASGLDASGEKRPGRIVNLLDWRALRPGPDHFPYTISKAALYALTRSLAVSLAPQVTVNGIALGAVLPPSDGADPEGIVSGIPNPRWARLEELESTLLFLLTGPDYITGEVIHIDGGRHLV